ncbi:MAG: tetratricopeptide repeat protein [Desulfuromonadaceae bacterium]|nr:tetratricopeptide repeat protein [Desulfuromonadaceae bacterium]
MYYWIFPLMLLVSVLLPTPAFPWGSLFPGETHQYIIDIAYNRLIADPAYAANLFPTLSMIKGHEGVQWTANGLFGVGPDGAGMSTYSEHYYNPKTGEGNGPTSSARHFSALVRSNLSGKPNTEAGGKAAAYSAHFLADMFVPYHVVGTSRKNAEKIWVEQNTVHPGTINLGISITGSQKLTYLTPFKGGNNNFNTELTRFITLTDPPESDWFDPWYYNGNTDTMMIKTSSHVAWEAIANGTPVITIHKRAGQGVPGYDPQWKNAAIPRFNQNIWDGQSQQVSKLAIFSATETRSRLETYFADPTPGLMNAIQSVFSIWRASFSGLRPTIAYQPDGKNSYKITGNIGNTASAPVNSVQVRLTAKDCTLSGSQEQTLGLIGAGLGKATAPWNVTTTDKLCNLKLEVVGSYPIPDLQYAFVETLFFPQKQEPEPVKPLKKTDFPLPQQTIVDKNAKGAWVLVDVSRKAWDLPNINDDVIMKRVPGCKTQDGSNIEYTASSTDNSFSVKTSMTWNSKSGSNRRSWDIQGSWDKPPAALIPGDIFNFGCSLKQVNTGLGGATPVYAGITIGKAACSSNGTPGSFTAAEKIKVPLPDSDWDCRNYGRRCTEESFFRLGVDARVRNNNITCFTSYEHGPVPFLAYRTYVYKWKPGASGTGSDSVSKVISKPNLTTLLAEAEQLMLKHDDPKLLEVAEKIIAADPSLSEGYRFRGNARRGMNDNNRAKNDYDQALKLDPSNVRALNGLAQIKRKAGDLHGALADMNHVLQITPNYPAGLDTRAMIYYDLKEYQKCIADSSRALALTPGNATYLVRRGLALEQLNDFKGALKDYDAALARSPGDPYATKGRARVLPRL